MTSTEFYEITNTLFSQLRKYYHANNDYLENFSVKELEKISVYLYERHDKYIERDVWELVKDILRVRKKKIDKSFAWSEESMQKFIKINDELTKTFETAYNEALASARKLEERINNNDPLIKSYEIDILIEPYAWLENQDKDGYTFTHVLCEPLNDYQSIKDGFDYLNFERYEERRLLPIYLDKSMNWNNAPQIKGVFPDDVYIGYCIYQLFDGIWSLTDIENIYTILAEIKVTQEFFKDL